MGGIKNHHAVVPSLLSPSSPSCLPIRGHLKHKSLIWTEMQKPLDPKSKEVHELSIQTDLVQTLNPLHLWIFGLAIYFLWISSASSRKKAHSKFCLSRFWWDYSCGVPSFAPALEYSLTTCLMKWIWPGDWKADRQQRDLMAFSCLVFFLRLVWKEKALSQPWKLFLENKDFSQTASTKPCTG